MSNDETEVAQITETVYKIDEEINELHNRRSQQLTRRNNLTSVARHLPLEILTEIFRISAYKPNLRDPRLSYVDLAGLLKIGTVCTLWRQVAWGATQLWTTCLLKPRKYKEPPLPTWLTLLILNNCQDAVASIRLYLDDLSPEGMEVLCNPDNLARLRSIRVHLRDEGHLEIWNKVSRRLRAYEGSFRNLRELWVDLGPRVPFRTNISGLALQSSDSADAVEYVRREQDCLPFLVPASQLTALRLFDLPVDQCVYLLLHAQNLVEFHCVQPLSSSGLYSPPEMDFTKSLYSIKELRWRVFIEEWNMFLFTSIRFPCLERLIWGSFMGPERNSPSDRMLWSSFFPSLNRTLIALELEWEVSTHEFFSTLVADKIPFDRLEELYFAPLSPGSLVKWFDMLTIDESRNLLPGLKTLHVYLESVSICEAEVFSALRRFLCSRRWSREANEGGTNGKIGLDELERLIVERVHAPTLLEKEQAEVLNGFVSGGLVVELRDEESDRSTVL